MRAGILKQHCTVVGCQQASLKQSKAPSWTCGQENGVWAVGKLEPRQKPFPLLPWGRVGMRTACGPSASVTQSTPQSPSSLPWGHVGRRTACYRQQA